MEMKGSAVTLLVPLLLVLAQGAFAYVHVLPSSSRHQNAVTKTALQAEKHNFSTAASTTLLVGLSLLSAPPAIASNPPQPSSSIYVSEIEQFALPSYEAAKGTTLIDLNAEVAKVNKKTLQAAQSKREAADKSPQKLEADRLRKEEKDGGSLLGSLLEDAEAQKKQAIADEIAESRANRWKTF